MAEEPRNQLELFRDILLYKVNFFVGCICMFTVIINLSILLVTKKFRKQFQFLIGLGAADFCTMSGYILEACFRHELFVSVSKTLIIPIVTSADCLHFWTIILTLGDFTAPMIQILMALERFFAVTRPTNLFTCFHSWIPLFAVLCISVLIIAIPSAISLIDPIPNVRYGCGRKAAFSTAFGIIDYITNIFGFTFAFGLNLYVLYKAHQMSLSSKQCQKIRAYTVISFISTVLISIPNLCSLINATIVRVPDLLITPTAIMACINCSMQFFVYFYFSREYRNRVLFLFTLGKLKNGFPTKIQTKTAACVMVNKHEISNVRDYF